MNVKCVRLNKQRERKIKMKKFKVGDMVKGNNKCHIKTLKAYDTRAEIISIDNNLLATVKVLQHVYKSELGKEFKVELNELDLYVDEEKEKLKSELERITEAQKDTLGRFKESRGLNQELIKENKDLQEQLDYADKQLEKQAEIILKLEDHVHELHDRLVEEIKGGEIC